MSSPIPGGAVVPIRPRELGDPNLDGGERGHHPPDMSDISGRVAKIEGTISALQLIVGVLAAVIIGGVTFLGVQITRIDNRVANLDSKVDSLPDKINANLLNLTKTLSDAITAAKQQPPQIILMPAPTLPQPQQQK
jgi:hypothetical protein